jgi:RNase H-fold protein (predicted Holliday junction resolvase)
MQSSASLPSDGTAGAASAVDVGIDPGLVKCGYAVVTLGGNRLALEIVPTPRLAERLAQDLQARPVRTICLGNATKSEMVLRMIRASWPTAPVTIVDERNTSLEARRRYYDDHPPRGLWRLVPRGLLVPKEQLDGYAALLIIERFRASLKSKA